MRSKVDEIAPDVFRISTFNSDFGIQFNQFLVKDDEPFLMHTGMKSMLPATLEGVSSVIDPSSLRWIGFSHFESDECGALNDWLQIAPACQAVNGFVGVTVNLNDYAIRSPRLLSDNETFAIGRHRLRYLATPHVPHGWDAGLFFDEFSQTLFCSDLFFQPGDPGPSTGADIVSAARDAMQEGQNGPLAGDMPYTAHTKGVLKRLADLDPKFLAVMHGSSFKGDGRQAIIGLSSVIKTILG